MSKTLKMATMQDYLDLEIKRLEDVGLRFPPELVTLLRQRAKGLDKQVAAERMRQAYGGEPLAEDDTDS